MEGHWFEPDLRDEVVNSIKAWHTLTSIPRTTLLDWVFSDGLPATTGAAVRAWPTSHNPPPHQSHWTLPQEREAVITCARENPGEDCRRLSYMMIDADAAYLSPETVYRILPAEKSLPRPASTGSKSQTTKPSGLNSSEVTFVRFRLNQYTALRQLIGRF